MPCWRRWEDMRTASDVLLFASSGLGGEGSKRAGSVFSGSKVALREPKVWKSVGGG